MIFLSFSWDSKVVVWTFCMFVLWPWGIFILRIFCFLLHRPLISSHYIMEKWMAGFNEWNIVNLCIVLVFIIFMLNLSHVNEFLNLKSLTRLGGSFMFSCFLKSLIYYFRCNARKKWKMYISLITFI